MDMKETSAMTDASGLVDDPAGAKLAREAREAAADATARRQSSPSDAAAWADRLREITVKAPLQSLFVAFLLGVWVARR
ncbi:hypothetical protein JQ631_28675 [Bradyrhizobium manausense]|uniref:hypothetical protein n=1 Tax=Bradyrhizobium manausense TaxID=989370 RepID=UPI001BA980AD|nr:hypothetical protein [Bradyrhizobium manausense]MBR0793067.1 hypothetical protein [Bradyrhizobium manausense]